MPLAENTVRDAFESTVKYAKQKGVSELLKEYLVRVLSERPDDPVAFLLEEIAKRPFAARGEWGFESVTSDAETAAAFFRLPESQSECRRRVAKAAEQSPTVLAHGSLHTGQLVRTKQGLRLTVPFFEQSSYVDVAEPGECLPYVVDLVSALVSVELDRRAWSRQEGTDRNGLIRFAPKLLEGYLRGLEAAVSYPENMVPKLEPRPPIPALSTDEQFSLGDPISEESALVACVVRDFYEGEPATLREAGALPGGRVLLSMRRTSRTGEEITSVVEAYEATSSSNIEALQASAACYGAPKPRLLAAAPSESHYIIAVELEPCYLRISSSNDEKDEKALALWLGAALGISHARCPQVAVDAVKRDATSRFAEWIALAGDIAAELTVAFEEYKKAAAATTSN